jgi:hypothetical protein
MNALFYNQLIADSPLVRDHVRLGLQQDGVESHNFRANSREMAPTGISSSFAVLDAFLPWHGWPVGAVTEIMTDTVGCGELSLLLPAMARLTRQKRPILCVGSPHALFAPALADAGLDPAWVTQVNPASTTKNAKENLWSVEQALKTGLPGMVVLWSHPHSNCPAETLRRLHLATTGRETTLIHFRGASSMSQPSPAWLRFGYASDDSHIRLQVIKCRSRELARPLIVLDRAAVQARLYGQLRNERLLDLAIQHGTPVFPVTSAGNDVAIQPLKTACDSSPSHQSPRAEWMTPQSRAAH